MTRLLAACLVTTAALTAFGPSIVEQAVAEDAASSAKKAQKMLRHVVMFQFKDDADPADIEKVEKAFAALPAKIDSIKDFEWGKNNSPEGLNDGLTHCFLVTFDSEQGRAKYLPHPAHKAFVEVLKPVLEKATVIDFWAN